MTDYTGVAHSKCSVYVRVRMCMRGVRSLVDEIKSLVYTGDICAPVKEPRARALAKRSKKGPSRRKRGERNGI